MRLTMKLVERRELEYEGQPQVKLTFVPPIQKPLRYSTFNPKPMNKLTLFLSVAEAVSQFGTVPAGGIVILSIDQPQS
jgi:hypothetical protein